MMSVLFVDDERRVLDGLQRQLRSRRNSWSMHFADSGAAALAEMERTAFDVVVTDMRMAPMDGVGLLAEVQRRQPGVARLILSGHTEPDAAVKAASVAHQFLSKPCEPRKLISALDRLASVYGDAKGPRLTNICGLHVLPTSQAVYERLGSLLDQPSIPLDRVGRLVEGDVATAARVLHLVQSSFFGHSWRGLGIAEAVRSLGGKVLRDLFLAGSLCRPVSGAEADRLTLENRRARRVARVAGGLADGLPIHSAALLRGVGRWLGTAKHAPADPTTVAEDGRTLLLLWGIWDTLGEEVVSAIVARAAAVVAAIEVEEACAAASEADSATLADVVRWRQLASDDPMVNE